VNLSSYLVERVTRLGPPQTRDLTVQRDLRVPMPDGTILLADRWAPKVRFRASHQIRLQVSSGAFPRYARNLGNGEPLLNASTWRVADQEVHHDPGHPSAVILPVV
jgi:predicted acyl esterase